MKNIRLVYGSLLYCNFSILATFVVSYLVNIAYASKSWSQIIQCPPGTNGPIKWQMFSCEVKIPAGITKIRPVLNAGWSSENGKEATTWFDILSITKTPITNTSITKTNTNASGGEIKSNIAGFIPSASLL